MLIDPSARRRLGRAPVIANALLLALRAGHTLASAASAVGVGRNTFLKWRRDDPVFAAAVEAARAEGVAVIVEARLKQLGYEQDSIR